MDLISMSIQYTIHKANANDAELIAPLFNEYRKFYKQKDNIRLSAQFLQDRLFNSQSIVFFAFDPIKKICCGFVQLYPSFSSVQAKSILILNDLFVYENYREQGIGRSLINNAHNYAISNGYASVILETASYNHSAQKLYQNLGYKENKDYINYIFKV
jgi:ribosomal protein S18 acetylase RimI-like enzyme